MRKLFLVLFFINFNSLNANEITFSVEIAHSIAKFSQACVKADRKSIIKQSNLSVKEGLEYEWYNSIEVLSKEGIEGAERFSKGHGRHGDFEDI